MFVLFFFPGEHIGSFPITSGPQRVPRNRQTASFRFEDEDEDEDENEDQVQLLLIVRMLKSVTVMA